MERFDADMYRDLTDAEIIALAETRVFLIEHGTSGKWSWSEQDPAKARAVAPWFENFPSKLAAADDAVCTLDLDQ